MFRIPHRLICKNIIYTVVVSFLLIACEQQPEKKRFDISGETMGTYYRVTIIDNDVGKTDDRLTTWRNDIDGVLETVNSQMSTYINDSQISKFNQLKDDRWFDVSSELVLVAQKAKQIFIDTQGQFDPTIAPLVNLWSFGSEQRPTRIPKNDELAVTRNAVGADKLLIRDQPPALKKAHPALMLDLSAIAKGYAVDKIADLLITRRLNNFLIDIGGELRAQGKNLDQKRWQVGIEKPQSQLNKSVQKIVSLSGKSIATSGSYRNYFEDNNKRYSHIINPLSGAPIEHTLVSVSVISDDCMSADAYATALMVMGPKRGYDFALQYGLAVYMIEKKADELVSIITPQMKPFME